MTAIADAIRDKTGETEPLTLDAMAESIPFVYSHGYVAGNEEGFANGEASGFESGRVQGHEEGFREGEASGRVAGFDAGKQAEYDTFWDEYQTGGERTNYNYAFSYMGWRSVTYNPKYPIVIRGTNTCTNVYAYSGVTDTKVDITFTKTSGTSSAYNFLGNATNMVTVRKVTFNDATTFNNASFQNCTKLETMNVEGVIGQSGLNLQWSTLLNKASIESVINALSSATSGLTVTFSKTAINNAFETAEGLADGSTSDTWKNLIATKSNWTISLV
ncbi:MAG: hypothetical protein J6Q59_02475 [Paludibacteraceae bacterium]|nr:hypothetical protein [Paludibacteraceae bacterium]